MKEEESLYTIKYERPKVIKVQAENAFEIVVKGLTEDEKESLKEVIDKEIRRIKYRRHKTETSNLRYVIDLNS
ncbi:MAG: hypothetical protein PUD90_09660 [Clostridia bacterium]|nr:hypothetical protein [Clostridia bacterium]